MRFWARSCGCRLIAACKFTAAACLLAVAAADCAPSARYASERNASERNASERPQPDARAPRGKPQRHLEQAVESYIGTPYRYGGTTRAGFDCSGFVTQVYREVYGKPLPRSSVKMWEAGQAVPVSAARPGDLVFFKGGTFGLIDHVGIYMGGSRFAHASTTRGVVYSDLRETYYARRFAGARRML